MDPFQDSVLTTTKRYELLREGQRVVVALSGGPDSVALLLALIELRPQLGVTVEAAHVNHLLRGAESDDDERFVRGLCGAAAIPLHVRRVETRQGAVDGRQNLEDYARKVRYQFLLEVAAAVGAKVATGHTLNDLSETFLLKLFRGAGLSGLSGVYPLRRNRLESGANVDVVRPLLHSTRTEILDYLARRGQSFRQDSSNRDVAFDRNLLRHQLLPLLQERFNPELIRVLGRTALLFRELEDYLSPLLDQAYEMCREEGDSPALRVSQLLSQHPFVQKEIVRRALKELRGDLKDVSSRHLEDILQLASGQSGSECHLGSGVRVRREFDLLQFGREKEVLQFDYELPVPGDVYIDEVGKRIVARLYAGAVPPAACEVASSRVFLRFRGSCLRVRNRRAGDRYRIGTRTRKLKEILIEKKIPRSWRDELLVLDEGGEILWVEGMLPNPDFRVEPGCERALEIAVERETFPR